MMISFVLVILTLTISIVWYLYASANRRPKLFPPGPAGIPIFGNALQFGLEHYKTALGLKGKYGDVIGVRMGSQWVVYLNNPVDIKDAFSKVEFTSKYLYNPLMDTKPESLNSGLLFSVGQKWADHRRFTLRTLRDFGFGKRTSEGIIMEEVRDLILRLKKMTGKPFSTHNFFNPAVFNVIWSMLAGQRYEHDDPALKKLIEVFTDFLDSGFSGIRPLFFLFPGLLEIKNRFPTFFSEKHRKFRDRLFSFFEITIEHHKKTAQVGQPRDYIDALLEESRKIDDFEEIDIYVTLLDLFVTGSDSISTTLMWTFLLLGEHPEVQEKLVNEILAVVGSREVALSDKPSLPYVEATTLEILRLGHIAPFGAPHASSQDLVYKGFSIPKNTIVLGNLYACLMSPDVWGDPGKFRPERFLSSDGNSVDRNKAWIPFGAGKRSCLGESLARDEIFLFLTNVCQKLRITMPFDEPTHSLEGLAIGISRLPRQHRIVVNIRNDI